MSKPKLWRIVPLRVGFVIYWVAFYTGYKVGRSTDLARLLNSIALAERRGGNVARWFVGEQW